MGWEKPEKNFVYFLLYMAFFPRFLSGPIDRSNKFLPQLKVNQSFNEQNITEGFRLVLFGLFKKIAIANQLALIVSSAYASLNSSDENALWVIFLVQPLFLYFDFSGYTDIAFGIARAFGIELRPNFNQPFMSENVSNFWKRFHISLSSWFHDYVFMRTLFKVRKWKKKAPIFSLFATWMLFGVWHGGGWNFVLLGLLQAIAIYYEYSTRKWRVHIFSKLPGFLRRWMGRILTYLFYSASLVFFFANDMSSVFVFFSKMSQGNYMWPVGIRVEVFILVLVFSISFLIFEIIQSDYSNTYNRIESFWNVNKTKNKLLRWALYFILITMVIVFNANVQQFIYHQF